jgi:hypothetical protein
MKMSNKLIINMQRRDTGVCGNCGAPASPQHGLPVSNGEIVSNDFHGEWGGVAACEQCFNNHAEGRLIRGSSKRRTGIRKPTQAELDELTS